MADDQELETPEEETAETSAEQIFAEKLQELSEQREPATEEETPEADAETQESDEQPTEEETPEEVKPVTKGIEGTSVAMRAFAKQQGVPDEMISLAANDEHLETYIKHYAASREEEPAEPEKEQPFALSLPEEEFAKDDPVRKQFGEVVEHFEEKLETVFGYLGQLADVALKTEQAVKQSVDKELTVEQGAFDEFIDTLGHPALGSRQDNSIPSAGQKARSMIYWHAKDLQVEHPRTPAQKLYEMAAKEFGYLSKQEKRQDAIKDANKGRLGGGSAKPLPEPKLTGEALALSKIQEALSRNS